jgi:hypothetical protein
MRFDAEGYGYRRGVGSPGWGMYVDLYEDSSKPTGYGKYTENTWVTMEGELALESGQGTLAEWGGSVAHEEVHHRLYGHDSGEPQRIEDLCN